MNTACNYIARHGYAGPSNETVIVDDEVCYDDVLEEDVDGQCYMEQPLGDEMLVEDASTVDGVGRGRLMYRISAPFVGGGPSTSAHMDMPPTLRPMPPPIPPHGTPLDKPVKKRTVRKQEVIEEPHRPPPVKDYHFGWPDYDIVYAWNYKPQSNEQLWNEYWRTYDLLVGTYKTHEFQLAKAVNMIEVRITPDELQFLYQLQFPTKGYFRCVAKVFPNTDQPMGETERYMQWVKGGYLFRISDPGSWNREQLRALVRQGETLLSGQGLLPEVKRGPTPKFGRQMTLSPVYDTPPIQFEHIGEHEFLAPHTEEPKFQPMTKPRSTSAGAPRLHTNEFYDEELREISIPFEPGEARRLALEHNKLVRSRMKVNNMINQSHAFARPDIPPRTYSTPPDKEPRVYLQTSTGPPQLLQRNGGRPSPVAARIPHKFESVDQIPKLPLHPHQARAPYSLKLPVKPQSPQPPVDISKTMRGQLSEGKRYQTMIMENPDNVIERDDKGRPIVQHTNYLHNVKNRKRELPPARNSPLVPIPVTYIKTADGRMIKYTRPSQYQEEPDPPIRIASSCPTPANYETVETEYAETPTSPDEAARADVLQPPAYEPTQVQIPATAPKWPVQNRAPLPVRQPHMDIRSDMWRQNRIVVEDLPLDDRIMDDEEVDVDVEAVDSPPPKKKARGRSKSAPRKAQQKQAANAQAQPAKKPAGRRGRPALHVDNAALHAVPPQELLPSRAPKSKSRMQKLEHVEMLPPATKPRSKSRKRVVVKKEPQVIKEESEDGGSKKRRGRPQRKVQRFTAPIDNMKILQTMNKTSTVLTRELRVMRLNARADETLDDMERNEELNLVEDIGFVMRSVIARICGAEELSKQQIAGGVLVDPTEVLASEEGLSILDPFVRKMREPTARDARPLNTPQPQPQEETVRRSERKRTIKALENEEEASTSSPGRRGRSMTRGRQQRKPKAELDDDMTSQSYDSRSRYGPPTTLGKPIAPKEDIDLFNDLLDDQGHDDDVPMPAPNPTQAFQMSEVLSFTAATTTSLVAKTEPEKKPELSKEEKLKLFEICPHPAFSFFPPTPAPKEEVVPQFGNRFGLSMDFMSLSAFFPRVDDESVGPPKNISEESTSNRTAGEPLQEVSAASVSSPPPAECTCDVVLSAPSNDASIQFEMVLSSFVSDTETKVLPAASETASRCEATFNARFESAEIEYKMPARNVPCIAAENSSLVEEKVVTTIQASSDHYIVPECAYEEEVVYADNAEYYDQEGELEQGEASLNAEQEDRRTAKRKLTISTSSDQDAHVKRPAVFANEYHEAKPALSCSDSSSNYAIEGTAELKPAAEGKPDAVVPVGARKMLDKILVEEEARYADIPTTSKVPTQYEIQQDRIRRFVDEAIAQETDVEELDLFGDNDANNESHYGENPLDMATRVKIMWEMEDDPEQLDFADDDLDESNLSEEFDLDETIAIEPFASDVPDEVINVVDIDEPTTSAGTALRRTSDDSDTDDLEEDISVLAVQQYLPAKPNRRWRRIYGGGVGFERFRHVAEAMYTLVSRIEQSDDRRIRNEIAIAWLLGVKNHADLFPDLTWTERNVHNAIRQHAAQAIPQRRRNLLRRISLNMNKFASNSVLPLMPIFYPSAKISKTMQKRDSLIALAKCANEDANDGRLGTMVAVMESTLHIVNEVERDEIMDLNAVKATVEQTLERAPIEEEAVLVLKDSTTICMRAVVKETTSVSVTKPIRLFKPNDTRRSAARTFVHKQSAVAQLKCKESKEEKISSQSHFSKPNDIKEEAATHFVPIPRTMSPVRYSVTERIVSAKFRSRHETKGSAVVMLDLKRTASPVKRSFAIEATSAEMSFTRKEEAKRARTLRMPLKREISTQKSVKFTETATTMAKQFRAKRAALSARIALPDSHLQTAARSFAISSTSASKKFRSHTKKDHCRVTLPEAVNESCEATFKQPKKIVVRPPTPPKKSTNKGWQNQYDSCQPTMPSTSWQSCAFESNTVPSQEMPTQSLPGGASPAPEVVLAEFFTFDGGNNDMAKTPEEVAADLHSSKIAEEALYHFRPQQQQQKPQLDFTSLQQHLAALPQGSPSSSSVNFTPNDKILSMLKGQPYSVPSCSYKTPSPNATSASAPGNYSMNAEGELCDFDATAAFEELSEGTPARIEVDVNTAPLATPIHTPHSHSFEASGPMSQPMVANDDAMSFDYESELNRELEEITGSGDAYEEMTTMPQQQQPRTAVSQFAARLDDSFTRPDSQLTVPMIAAGGSRRPSPDPIEELMAETEHIPAMRPSTATPSRNQAAVSSPVQPVEARAESIKSLPTSPNVPIKQSGQKGEGVNLGYDESMGGQKPTAYSDYWSTDLQGAPKVGPDGTEAPAWAPTQQPASVPCPQIQEPKSIPQPLSHQQPIVSIQPIVDKVAPPQVVIESEKDDPFSGPEFQICMDGYETSKTPFGGILGLNSQPSSVAPKTPTFYPEPHSVGQPQGQYQPASAQISPVCQIQQIQQQPTTPQSQLMQTQHTPVKWQDGSVSAFTPTAYVGNQRMPTTMVANQAVPGMYAPTTPEMVPTTGRRGGKSKAAQAAQQEPIAAALKTPTKRKGRISKAEQERIAKAERAAEEARQQQIQQMQMQQMQQQQQQQAAQDEHMQRYLRDRAEQERLREERERTEIGMGEFDIVLNRTRLMKDQANREAAAKQKTMSMQNQQPARMFQQPIQPARQHIQMVQQQPIVASQQQYQQAAPQQQHVSYDQWNAQGHLRPAYPTQLGAQAVRAQPMVMQQTASMPMSAMQPMQTQFVQQTPHHVMPQQQAMGSQHLMQQPGRRLSMPSSTPGTQSSQPVLAKQTFTPPLRGQMQAMPARIQQQPQTMAMTMNAPQMQQRIVQQAPQAQPIGMHRQQVMVVEAPIQTMPSYQYQQYQHYPQADGQDQMQMQMQQDDMQQGGYPMMQYSYQQQPQMVTQYVHEQTVPQQQIMAQRGRLQMHPYPQQSQQAQQQPIQQQTQMDMRYQQQQNYQQQSNIFGYPQGTATYRVNKVDVAEDLTDKKLFELPPTDEIREKVKREISLTPSIPRLPSGVNLEEIAVRNDKSLFESYEKFEVFIELSDRQFSKAKKTLKTFVRTCPVGMHEFVEANLRKLELLRALYEMAARQVQQHIFDPSHTLFWATKSGQFEKTMEEALQSLNQCVDVVCDMSFALPNSDEWIQALENGKDITEMIRCAAMNVIGSIAIANKAKLLKTETLWDSDPKLPLNTVEISKIELNKVIQINESDEPLPFYGIKYSDGELHRVLEDEQGAEAVMKDVISRLAMAMGKQLESEYGVRDGRQRLLQLAQHHAVHEVRAFYQSHAGKEGNLKVDDLIGYSPLARDFIMARHLQHRMHQATQLARAELKHYTKKANHFYGKLFALGPATPLRSQLVFDIGDESVSVSNNTLLVEEQPDETEEMDEGLLMDIQETLKIKADDDEIEDRLVIVEEEESPIRLTPSPEWPVEDDDTAATVHAEFTIDRKEDAESTVGKMYKCKTVYRRGRKFRLFPILNSEFNKPPAAKTATSVFVMKNNFNLATSSLRSTAGTFELKKASEQKCAATAVLICSENPKQIHYRTIREVAGIKSKTEEKTVSAKVLHSVCASRSKETVNATLRCSYINANAECFITWTGKDEEKLTVDVIGHVIVPRESPAKSQSPDYILHTIPLETSYLSDDQDQLIVVDADVPSTLISRRPLPSCFAMSMNSDLKATWLKEIHNLYGGIERYSKIQLNQWKGKFCQDYPWDIPPPVRGSKEMWLLYMECMHSAEMFAAAEKKRSFMNINTDDVLAMMRTRAEDTSEKFVVPRRRSKSTSYWFGRTPEEHYGSLWKKAMLNRDDAPVSSFSSVGLYSRMNDDDRQTDVCIGIGCLAPSVRPPHSEKRTFADDYEEMLAREDKDSPIMESGHDLIFIRYREGLDLFDTEDVEQPQTADSDRSSADESETEQFEIDW